MLEKAGQRNLEQKIVRCGMVLNSWGSLFHSLRPALEKALSPAQTSFTLMLGISIVPDE